MLVPLECVVFFCGEVGNSWWLFQSMLLGYWATDFSICLPAPQGNFTWRSMSHPLEDPATLIGSLIYTPWKFNISASKVAISSSKAWTYPQHLFRETSKSKHTTKDGKFQGYVHFAVDYPKLHSSPSLFKHAMILSPLKLPVATKPSNRRNPSKWTLGWLAVRLTGLSKAPPPTKTKTSGLPSNHKPNIYMFLVKLLVFRDFQGCNCQSEFWGFATTDITFPISLVACSEHTCRWTPKNTDRKSGALKNVLCWTCFLLEVFGIQYIHEST